MTDPNPNPKPPTFSIHYDYNGHWIPLETGWEIPKNEFTDSRTAIAAAIQQAIRTLKPTKVISSSGPEMLVNPVVQLRVDMEVSNGMVNPRESLRLNPALLEDTPSLSEAIANPDIVLRNARNKVIKEVPSLG